MDTIRVIVSDCRGDQLVCTSCVPKAFEPVCHLSGRADKLRLYTIGDKMASLLIPNMTTSLIGSGELEITLSGTDAAHPQPVAGSRAVCSLSPTTRVDASGGTNAPTLRAFGGTRSRNFHRDFRECGRDIEIQGRPHQRCSSCVGLPLQRP